MAWTKEQVQTVLNSSTTLSEDIVLIIIDNDRKLFVDEEVRNSIEIDYDNEFIKYDKLEGQSQIPCKHYISFGDIQGIMVKNN